MNHHTERQKTLTLTSEEQTEGGRRGQTSVKSFQNSLISQEFEQEKHGFNEKVFKINSF